jgi:hypothetical protein
MDPITVGAVLLAVVTGVSEALGGQLWTGVVSLVRRPPDGKKAPVSTPFENWDLGSGTLSVVTSAAAPSACRLLAAAGSAAVWRPIKAFLRAGRRGAPGEPLRTAGQRCQVPSAAMRGPLGAEQK